MQIDWLTTSAQIVNFLILIILLKKLLYRPILENMDLRRQRIADKLHEAEKMQQVAERSAEDYRIKKQELEAQRASILDDLNRDIEDRRARMIEELRAEVNQKRLTWYADFAEEKNSAREEIKAMLGDKIMRLSRKALADLAGAELEQQIAGRFLEELRQLPETERALLAKTFSAQGRIEVLTHFPVSEQDRASIRGCLKGIHSGLEVDFKQSPEIICGIILEAEGYSWPWTFDRYLEEFEEWFAKKDHEPEASQSA
ncbi:MAG: F0F1 ATP synthase subunit B family protein [Gammaproteobacteria bacterium]